MKFKNAILAAFVLALLSATAMPEEKPTKNISPQKTPPKTIIPLKNAHSHNDYYRQRPLLDALDQGFCSVEADIFLHEGRLLVGHFQYELKVGRTLKELYLDPLQKRTKSNGSVYQKGIPFTLLIDIKSNGPKTYAALRKLLAEYPDMLSVVDSQESGGDLQQRAVTIIISGSRPKKEMAAANPRRAGIDGRLSDLKSKTPGHLIPLISDHWGRNFRWSGEGPMPKAERQRLHKIVEQAHASGRRVRFWATPDRPALWDELLEAGVDLIGTDDLETLGEYLKNRKD